MNGRCNSNFYARLLTRAGWIAKVGVWALAVSAVAQDELPPPPMPAEGPALNPAVPDAVAPDSNAPHAEVLTRGPIHEAYAMPTTDAPGKGMVVPKRPPNPIEEQAPDVKPQGNNAIWIPGYWSWDDDRNDFIWTSGVWRVAPPGQRWVPGYWQEGQDGWHWVSGYWIPTNKSEAVYMPQPPASVEQGPTSPAPSESNFWVPGHWLWRGDRYVWVPGYWAVARPNLVWVYPTYTWTPRGWIYCEGYWDYPLEQRGLLFAPVYFARPVVYYRPEVVVDVGIVSGSLFCRPVYRHYYFGDYYADTYVTIGIRPWFVYCGPRYGYDPLFCYYRYHYRHDPHWEARLHGLHDYYRARPEMRPPRTLAEQQRLLADPRVQGRPDVRNLAVGHPVGQLKDNPGGPIRVQSVPSTQRAAIQQSARQISSLRNERVQLESKASAGGLGRAPGATGPTAPDRVNLARLPSLQTAGVKSGGPLMRGRPVQQRPSGASQGQRRPDAQDRQESESRQDVQPRQEFPWRQDFQSRQDFQPRSDFQPRQGPSGRGPRFEGPRGGR